VTPAGREREKGQGEREKRGREGERKGTGWRIVDVLSMKETKILLN